MTSEYFRSQLVNEERVSPLTDSHRKEDTDWVKKCMEYEVDVSRPRGRPKRTWKEAAQKDC